VCAVEVPANIKHKLFGFVW